MPLHLLLIPKLSSDLCKFSESSHKYPSTHAFSFSEMDWIINWAMNTHINTQTHMRPRIIKRKSPWLCKTLALRNEKDLRNKTISEPERPPENSLVHGPVLRHRWCSQDWMAEGRSALNSSCLAWTNSLLSLTQLKTPSGQPGNSFRKHIRREQCLRCWGEGLICTVPVLCSASPDEGCWGPDALETPYKGSLCGFLKLILSESPEANSVQLDYHSLLLNSAVFQCLLLNEFTVFNGELLTVIIPAVKWAAFSLASYAGQPQAPREQASAPWLVRSSLHLPPIHPQRIIFC